VKANSVKQEYEKQDELKRSALRAVSALSQIPKASEFVTPKHYVSVKTNLNFYPIDKNQQLVDFLKSIKETPELNKTYEYIQKDSITGSSDIIVMDQS